ncbi:MAG: hypothetical protein MJ146_04060 [Clostridia bacterium]|nr:hypothetical protein [Clostridia bacterium]
MVYKGQIKERQPWVNVLIFILAAYLTWREFAAGQYIYIILGVIVMAACFFKKEHHISDQGVDIVYFMFDKVFKHNLWTWDEITTIHPDYTKAAPNVMLHIGKDVVTRSFIYKKSQVAPILELAREKNANIYIDDATQKQQQEKAQEIARARKAAKKKKKK